MRHAMTHQPTLAGHAKIPQTRAGGDDQGLGMPGPTPLVANPEAIADFKLSDPRLDDIDGKLAAFFQEMDGEILAGKCTRQGQSLNLPDSGHLTAEHAGAFQQRHATAEPRGMPCGRKSGQPSADDQDLTGIV